MQPSTICLAALAYSCKYMTNMLFAQAVRKAESCDALLRNTITYPYNLTSVLVQRAESSNVIIAGSKD
jgi:hypothetical protein